MAAKSRLDAELVRRGLARSREHAQALVSAGRVRVGGMVATKPATGVDGGASVQVLAEAGDEIARREPMARLGVDVGVVEHAQLDRVDPGSARELVHRRLECIHPRALARRTEPRRRGDVQLDDAMCRPPAR